MLRRPKKCLKPDALWSEISYLQKVTGVALTLLKMFDFVPQDVMI